MNDRELESLLADIESDLVERTAAYTDSDKIGKAICAFANDFPNHQRAGVVFLGVKDDGDCAHLAVTDELLLKLADLRSNGNIHPFPSMVVQKRVLRGCEVAVILVEPSYSPPVRFKGRTWIRVGPSTRIATPEEERRLAEKRRSRDLPFDLHPVTEATIEDLDLDLFRRVYLPTALAPDVLEGNQRTLDQQLSSLRFTTVGAEVSPTVVGMLVVGKDPRQFLPGDYIQFLRVSGGNLTDPIKDQKEIGGPLPDLLRLLDETLQVHVSVAVDVTSQATETRHPDYPLVALQQLVRNALMHRTYEGTNAPVRVSWFSDRIEIQNPGGPFGQVTRQNFGQPGITDYRNPNLAEALKNLGYVQRFGIGIQLARSELAKNGNPPLEFTVEEAHVLAIVRSRT